MGGGRTNRFWFVVSGLSLFLSCASACTFVCLCLCLCFVFVFVFFYLYLRFCGLFA